jgi:hypothetical protein
MSENRGQTTFFWNEKGGLSPVLMVFGFPV